MGREGLRQLIFGPLERAYGFERTCLPAQNRLPGISAHEVRARFLEIF